ncbi:hypothetical protein [Microbacterium rhizomatis]|uniref:Gluconate 2-dehydrogenase subunit 3 family protein n=1 Tax=Microbacterium rhizomatis TaxID=1631477 RepID=A0A5J5IXT8_9MICO|nr:hypothetical protein [Microbacterium rhizomatis]KAA9106065.1 hypothetical protein F6B43_17065 [Microbacterium rhizomatis]
MDHDSVDDALLRTATRVARLSFPHDVPGDVYATAAADALAEVSADPLIEARIQRALRWAVERDPCNDQLLAWLTDHSDEDWFRTFRQLVIPGIYGHPAVWARIGYEGPSHHLGGYLHRGFNDLTWLPEPRIEESIELMADIGPDTRSDDGETR